MRQSRRRSIDASERGVRVTVTASPEPLRAAAGRSLHQRLGRAQIRRKRIQSDNSDQLGSQRLGSSVGVSLVISQRQSSVYSARGILHRSAKSRSIYFNPFRLTLAIIGATRFGSSSDVSQELRCPAQRRLLRSVCRHCGRGLASPIALMRMLLSACCCRGACRWICPRGSILGKTRARRPYRTLSCAR
jgi:hypothetical protein